MEEKNLIERIKEKSKERKIGPFDGDIIPEIKDIKLVDGITDVAVVRYHMKDKEYWNRLISYDQIRLVKENEDGSLQDTRVIGYYTNPRTTIHVMSAKYDPIEEKIKLELWSYKHIGKGGDSKKFKAECKIVGGDFGWPECEDDDRLPPV